MAPTLSAEGKAKLDQILESEVASGEIPASTFAVATADANAPPIYWGVAGDRHFGDPSKGQINEDTVLQLMSMTKLVVTVAALQLIEKGKLSLDDPAVIEKNLPELWKLEILTEMKDGKPVTRKRTKPITLRHLLTHTNGTGYDLMVPLLGEWAKATGHKGVFASNLTIGSFESPLIFEPGEGWNYSLGLDWAGILIERVSGQSLDAYFKEHIFKPIGANTITFAPEAKHYENLQTPTMRDENLKVFAFPGARETAPEKIVGQASGGAGLYGTAKDYLRFLQAVMRSKEPGGIISPESYKLIFSHQLPDAPEGTYAGQYGFAALIPHIHPDLINNKKIGHSLGGFYAQADSPHGRKAGTTWWEGM
ncbi:beta-lactamase/transpeptidase-like protein [Cutaneotrichosporon oleaginosum]|uniref:Beta-lactamase/transpeptidase-like protein n=1 Tax=Cutaneotrichosporon oleaginosum TaxID=879819 RepID=A0A0J0XRX5_9TREE|nr:beta-lactamase/transpeptidase-like protein [Cutaneotrichosporon oleaginosum]KLT43858.1 beta-lactamase/transpeptidase-like protein [Cutaneotrichosporon oleaginosum]